MGHNYTSAFPAITDVLSRPGDNIVLLADAGPVGNYEAFAFNINEAVRRIEHLNDYFTVNDQNTLDLGYLGEDGHEVDSSSPGEDRFRIEGESEEIIEELAIGTSQPGKLALATPRKDTPVVGIEDDREASWDISSVEDGRGGVPADWTMDDDESVPTTALSTNPTQGIINIQEEDINNRIRLGVSNYSGSNETYSFDVLGRRYKVTNITDKSTVEDILFGDIPTRVLQWGSLENDQTERRMPDSWDGFEFDGEATRGLVA